MSTPTTPGPGHTLGRYRLTAELGRGAMGQVFLAEDTTLKQPVCVKLLHPQFLHHPEALARFTRELVLARRISHPGICRVYDLHDEGGHRFLTMEYIEGAPLKTLVGSRVSVERALRITQHLCDALAAAHDKGVVHRDLKPGNIMLRAGSDDDVCILDFGIAAAEDTAAQGLTRPGVALGTRLYIAPEVWGGAPATTRSDLFAVGVILFRLLTGAWPWGAEDLGVFERQRTQPPTRPSTLRPDVPAVVDALVASALAIDPDRRIESARAFGRACADILEAAGAPSSSAAPSSFSAAATIVSPRPVSMPGQTMAETVASSGTPSITDPLPEQNTVALSPVVSSDEASWVVSGRPVDMPVRPKVMEVKAPLAPPSTLSGTELVVRSGRRGGGRGPLLAVAGGLVVTALALTFSLRGGLPFGEGDVSLTDTGVDGGATTENEADLLPGSKGPAGAVDAGVVALSDAGPAPTPPDAVVDAGAPTGVEPVADAGSEASAPEPELTPPPPPAPRATPTTTRGQRLAADRALRDVGEAMRARGLVSGDDAELDRSREAARRALKGRRYDAAVASADAAIARAAAVRIDRPLVSKKLTRLNTRFDREKNAAKRAKLDEVAGRASAELAAGRLDAANRALNEGFAILGKDH